MPDNFAQFKAKIKNLVHAGGLARTLEYQFGEDCKQALIDLQRWIPGMKKRNREVHAACATYFACGATVVPKPRGKVQRVYTLEEGPCCPIYGDWEPDYDVFRNWLNHNRKAWTDPENVGMPALPAPFKFYEDSLGKGNRYNFGRYTFHNDQIWYGHRIEPTEFLVIEWDGIRRTWEDSTFLPYDDPDELGEDDKGVEIRNTVAAFVRSEDLRKNRRDLNGALAEMQVYNDMRADLKHDDWNDSQPAPMRLHKEGEYDYNQLNTAGANACRDAECQSAVEEDE